MNAQRTLITVMERQIAAIRMVALFASVWMDTLAMGKTVKVTMDSSVFVLIFPERCTM